MQINYTKQSHDADFETHRHKCSIVSDPSISETPVVGDSVTRDISAS